MIFWNEIDVRKTWACMPEAARSDKEEMRSDKGGHEKW